MRPCPRSPARPRVGFRLPFPISRCRLMRTELPAPRRRCRHTPLEAAMSRVGTVCLTLTLAVIAGCDAPAPITAPAPGVGPAALTTASVVVVLNTNDAGPGSLRQALADAVGDETIQFDPAIAGQTITLATGPLEVTQPLIIEGPAAGITIDANR